jgi:galactokinase/mevalonate kinase-like predicted kinase
MSLDSDVETEQEKQEIKEAAQKFIDLVMKHDYHKARNYLTSLKEDERALLKKELSNGKYKWTLRASRMGL